MENKNKIDIQNLLLDGQRSHAELFINFNKHRYIIVSKKGTNVYYFNESTKLWDTLSHSQLLCSVTDYLLLQINKQIDIIHVKNTKTQENNDLEDEAKIYLSTQNNKKIALLKKMNTQVQKATHGKAVIEFISSKLHDDKFMNKIDINEFMLPIKNGKILNLKTLEVRDRTINDYFSYEIDVNYTPKQKHANKFFRELMKDDKSKLSVLQRMLGYSITSNIESKCYFVLIGAGGDNGKIKVL